VITLVNAKTERYLMNKEIEVKIQISDEQLDMVKKWLHQNSTFCGEVQHEEYYLDNPTSPLTFISPEGFKDAHYYLRVRKSPEKGDSICLKKWYGDSSGKKTHCDEWEIAVSNGSTALELLNQLGFTNATPIKKTRCIYRFDEFEVVIDNVENLGVFIEVELKQNVDDVHVGLQRIYELIKKMGIASCKKQERGYTSMVWNPQYDFGELLELE